MKQELKNRGGGNVTIPAIVIATVILIGGLVYISNPTGKNVNQPSSPTPTSAQTNDNNIEENKTTNAKGAKNMYTITDPNSTNIPPTDEEINLFVSEAENKIAVIETARGKIKFKFYPKDAPYTVAGFMKLAKNGFYDGLNFHRVEPDFVIQGGDPLGNGAGGPGYNIKAEFNSQKHLEGTVAMARAQDINSAGSQFYITLAPQSFLDNNYTVFGQVIEGMEIVKEIQKGDKIKRIYFE